MRKAEDLNVGDVIGGFQIESVLGKGGMGVVYKAHELSLNRKVALKVLSHRLSSDEEFIRRFKREGQVIAGLDHPNIVRILSLGEEQGIYYFAMEYIKGKDLAQILKEKSVMPIEEALTITAQVASALAEADVRGVVHRDLKPSNIMIDEKGKVKITDFGVAHVNESDIKLTRTGWFLGTPEFASPEQASGAPLDVRSDIYSLGAVLYWMLAGRPPMTADSPQAVLIKIATESLPSIHKVNPSVPEPVCRLIEKMTAKDVNQRFQKPNEILSAINECTNAIKGSAQLASGRVQNKAGKPQRFYVKAIGGIAGIALAIFLIVWAGDALIFKKKPIAPPSKVAEATKQETTSDAVAPPNPVPAPDQSPSVPPIQEAKQVQETKQVPQPVVEKPIEKPKPKSLPPPSVSEQTASLKRGPALREVPNVLIMVSGDEGMVPLVRAHLESLVMSGGLRVTPVTEIPVLREKVQMGRMPISYYSVKEVVPPGKTDILLLAQVQKTGSTTLQYYGRAQEMITATFTVQVLDMASGISVESPATGSAQFTSLNMNDNLRDAVYSAASHLGEGIKKYWEEKRAASRKGG
jgi:serine/threonine protein kinase